MLNKIVLGTANFVQPYGILSEEEVMCKKDLFYILNKALDNGVSNIDTALGYGNIASAIPIQVLKKFKIITKISVLDSKDALLKKMEVYNGLAIEGLLIHDPGNIVNVNKEDLKNRLNFLKQKYEIKKIGVSVYDMRDIENFSPIGMPEIIQIPLNPLNQFFDNPSFIQWVKSNNVEVHARSLFMQGVLLSNTLPKKLMPLFEEWSSVKAVLKTYSSALQGLLLWAASREWIKHWVIGVSSVNDFNEILAAAILTQGEIEAPFFQGSNHFLVDPRNWK